ncbi:CPXCG motif-containing cysteine-rich protein [Billgrantia azerbaijanica]|nr:CPXCG motif-containing cysteine-rich protein [Halomonas azerbaijanica]
MHEEQLERRMVHCPYCDTPFELLVDASQGDQETWDDCPHCCAPIHLRIVVSPVDGELESVMLAREDEVL